MRAPEFWLADGDRKTIRFVDDDAIAAVRMYNVMSRGRPNKYVAPPEGEVDLFASELGLRAGRYFIFRIIDVDGYVSKKGPNAGKRVKNTPKFYVVGSRIYEQIRLQCIDTTGEPLNSGNVIACRAGEGQGTVYTFIPRPGAKTPEIKAAIMKFPKWTDFYRPPSESQQRTIVAQQGGGDHEE